MVTDTEILDFLQKLTDKSDMDGVIMRMSSRGSGWRLHETSQTDNKDVRKAITDFMEDR